MRLLLASVGNPDFNQDPDRPMWSCEPDKEVDVNSFAEASKACRQFINDNDLGGGNWAGGKIYEGSKLIAKVSYNGRVWDPDSGEEIVEKLEEVERI